MKKHSLVLLICCILFGVSLRAQRMQNPTFNANGQYSDINFATCSSIEDIDFCLKSPQNYENLTNYTHTYLFQLYRNGISIDQKMYATGDPEIDNCGGTCLPLHCFDDVEPLSGYYYGTVTIKRYLGSVYVSTPYTGQSDIINVSRPDDNTFAACTGNDSTEASGLCPNDYLKIYQFVSGQYFVTQNNVIYKFSNLGSTGLNMWGLSFNPPANLSGYSNLIGYQEFAAGITDMIYTPDGKTLISFNDGKVLKINGTGGTGSNMFAISESVSGFSTVGLYNYYAGHQKFLSGVNDLCYYNGYTFVGCGNGNMLKVTGSGGTNSNMFAVNETSTGFTSVGPYYSGHSHFISSVLRAYPVGSYMFVAFSDGKLLKVNGSGGTGSNMFGVYENTTDFWDAGFPYYSGHSKFQSFVTNLYNDGAYTFVCLLSGKIIKINGLGGTAGNMFAVVENSTGFTSVAGYNYLIGQCKYSSWVSNITHNAVGAKKLFIGFSNGKMMKITGSGGTGTDMFNATETAAGFQTTVPWLTNHLEGSTNFKSLVSDIKFFGSTQIVCLANSKALKITGNGGNGGGGYNMYAVSQQQNGFRPLFGTNYLQGSMAFIACSNPQRKSTHESESEEITGSVEKMNFSVYPSPFQDHLKIEVPEDVAVSDLIMDVYDVHGKNVDHHAFKAEESGIELSTEKYSEGMYIIVFRLHDQTIETKKIIKN